MRDNLDKNERTKKFIDKIVQDGYTEEEAKDIMMKIWLEKMVEKQ